MLELILVSMASYGCILASRSMYNYRAQERRLSAITSQPGLPLAMDQSMGNLCYSKHELIQVVACILLDLTAISMKIVIQASKIVTEWNGHLEFFLPYSSNRKF